MTETAVHNFLDFDKAFESVHQDSLSPSQRLQDPTADCPSHPQLLRQLHMEDGEQQVQF